MFVGFLVFAPKLEPELNFCSENYGGGNFFYRSESFEPIKWEVYEKVAVIGGCGILHNRFAGPEF